jgi:hypothetical protein
MIVFGDERPFRVEVGGVRTEGIVVGGRVVNAGTPLLRFLNYPIEELRQWVTDQGGQFVWLQVVPWQPEKR